MKPTTKRTGLIVLGVLLCVALIVGISSRFGTRPQQENPSIISKETNDPNPTVNINDREKGNANDLNIGIKTDAPETDPGKPGQGADSDGTEQTIQDDPVKPEAPAPFTAVEDDHKPEDVPESERNAETPPTYTPEQTTVTPPPQPQSGGENTGSGVYVPGFGYIESSGEGSITVNEDMYENGNKVGIMD